MQRAWFIININFCPLCGSWYPTVASTTFGTSVAIFLIIAVVIYCSIVVMNEQLSPTTHASASESSSALGLLPATEAWATMTWMVLIVLINLSFSLLGQLSPFSGSNHQVSAWLWLVLFCFLSKAGLFLLLAFGFLSGNKLSSLLLSVLTFGLTTLASKALLLFGVFLPFMSPAFYGDQTTVGAMLLTLSHTPHL